MQIKVITRHTPNNYGSLLQSIATLRVIESLGHQCEIIDYWKRDEVGLQGILTSLQGKSLWKNSLFKRMAYVALRYPGEKIAALRFDKMRRRYLKLTPCCYSMEELESLQADVFMTGSDQVWGPLLDGGYDEAYFLSFVKEGISFGVIPNTASESSTVETFLPFISTTSNCAIVFSSFTLSRCRGWSRPSPSGRGSHP